MSIVNWEYSPTYDWIDIEHTRYWLEKTSMRFNQKDKIDFGECDMREINGVLHQYGGRGTRFTFKIMLRSNGVFVDWADHFGKSKIEEVANR
jgi:hypothetical protein